MRKLHNQFHFSAFLPVFFTLFTGLLLAGCVSSGGNTQPWKETQTQTRPAEAIPSDLSVAAVDAYTLEGDQNALSELPPVKVAILLPLSGQHAKLGQAMLNAAQMALFDIGFDRFELMPKDTLGTPQGAQAAAKSALQDGAKLVLGPLFSDSVRAARQVTQSANINMIAFSTDWTLANRQTFLIGFLPFDQIERVTSYAVQKGYARIGVLNPQDNYGSAVVSAYKSISGRVGAQTIRMENIGGQGSNLNTTIRSFADYDARKASHNAHGTPFDAVLMPVGGTMAREIGSYLSHYDLPASSVKRLGTGLMDDDILATDSTLDGAWFAAPAPNARKKFERGYKTLYYNDPPRIASLAYDATALAAILARIGIQNNNRPAYDYASITNANGFSGVDGIFRFRPDGISERGLAILEYRNGRIVTIEDAPRTFQRSAY
tara:strand:- start:166 stop:1464 length:1299 start_codon:yes stop_codon:yes gene_type:complete